MTSSSDGNGHGKPMQPNYGRFIPREELKGFAAWKPGSIGGAAEPDTPPPPSADEIKAAVHAARQSGYQDGYRDGLVALEGFKQSFAQQMASQIGSLLQSFDDQLVGLEQQMAQAVARSATELARQVVRAELSVRPEIVAKVAEDAVNAVLHSARHIRLTVHPDDQLLVAHGAAETLAARNARLTTSSQIARGGCLVESDVGSIDARIETRWAQASATLGAAMPLMQDGTA